MNGRRFWGLIFILIGLGFVLENLGVVDVMAYLKIYWPCLVIALVLLQMIFKKRGQIGDGIVILIFAYIQLRMLDIVSISIMKLFWPAALILLGVFILFKKDRYDHTTILRDSSFHIAHIFSGSDYRYDGQDVVAGEIFTMFGGCDVDLRGANFVNKEIGISATALFGGIDIIVPEDCYVTLKGIPLFGGFSGPKTQPSERSERKVTVNVFVAFGGVEVKRKP